MRRVLGVAVGVVVLAGLSVTVLAADEQAQPAPKESKSPSRIAIAVGTVTKVDLERKTFELKSADGKITVFKVGDETRFRRSDKSTTFSELAVGNYLQLTYQKDDDENALARLVFVNEKAPTQENVPAKETSPPPTPQPSQ